LAQALVARVAIDTTVLTIDKAYDYLIPDTLSYVKIGCRVLVPFGRSNKTTEAIIIAFPEHSVYEKLKTISAVLDSEPVLNEECMKLAFHVRDRSFSTFYSVVKAMIPANYWFKPIISYQKAPDINIEELLIQFSDCKDALLLIQYVSDKEEVSKDSILDLIGEQGESLINEFINSGILIIKQKVQQQVREKRQKLYFLSQEGLTAYSTSNLQGSARNKIAEFLLSAGQATQKEIIYYTGVSSNTLTLMVKKGLVSIDEIEILRTPMPSELEDNPVIELNQNQFEVYVGLSDLLDAQEANCALLHGVTGSGKTLVYIELLKRIISMGKKGIVLVPEISLTPQLLKRFYSHFSGRVAVLHSALSVGERYDEWRRIRQGNVDVVIGTRSAIFAPLDKLGLVIIDEEHEHTYRSESMPRYHALDVAKYRCLQNKALLLLGSATPSIESMYKAKSGIYSLFSLNTRFGGALLPDIIISDSKKNYKNGSPNVIGPELYELLSEAFSKQEQAILLVNRRGSNRHIVCMECGYVPMCINCSVPLKYHSANNRLICHQCGYSQSNIDTCPECKKHNLESVGIGTQLVEAEVHKLFPEIKIIRMDSDTTSGKNSHEIILKDFESGKAQVLVGTQMIAKGLDFENVTVAAVIDADASIYSGDWRGSEQAFSMILQLTGRSGRGFKNGKAVIQTATPSNYVIKAAAEQNYMKFFNDEISLRRELKQPPFTKLITFIVSATIDKEAYTASHRVRSTLKNCIQNKNNKYDILGPAPAAIHKLNNIYRYCITLRGPDCRELRDIVWEILMTYHRKIYGNTSIFADANM